jgi:hypothetical protein
VTGSARQVAASTLIARTAGRALRAQVEFLDKDRCVRVEVATPLLEMQEGSDEDYTAGRRSAAATSTGAARRPHEGRLGDPARKADGDGFCGGGDAVGAPHACFQRRKERGVGAFCARYAEDAREP